MSGLIKDAFNYLTGGNKKESKTEDIKPKGKKGIEETEPETSTEEETETETETDNESLKSLKSITPLMKKKPLREKITPEEEEQEETKKPKLLSDEDFEEGFKEQDEETEAPTEETPTETPTEAPTEAEEKKIVPIKEETKITTYKDIFKTIEDFYEQNKGIEETFTKLESVINNMSDKMFDETFETVAEGIFNTTINGKKVFNTLEDAKKFIYEIRYNGKRGFRGQNTLKYKLPKKLQEGLQQEKQENQQLTPMMIRNIKQVPSSKYIYQY